MLSREALSFPLKCRDGFIVVGEVSTVAASVASEEKNLQAGQSFPRPPVSGLEVCGSSSLLEEHIAQFRRFGLSALVKGHHSLRLDKDTGDTHAYRQLNSLSVVDSQWEIGSISWRFY